MAAFNGSRLVKSSTVPLEGQDNLRVRLQVMGIDHYPPVFLDYSRCAHGSFPGIGGIKQLLLLLGYYISRPVKFRLSILI